MIIELLVDRTVIEDGEKVLLKKGTIHEFDGKRAEQYLSAKIAKKAKLKKKR